jgi:hypothetical protein
MPCTEFHPDLTIIVESMDAETWHTDFHETHKHGAFLWKSSVPNWTKNVENVHNISFMPVSRVCLSVYQFS